MITQGRYVTETLNTKQHSPKETMALLSTVPAWQWAVRGGWWANLSEYCNNRVVPEIIRRPVNGLNVEIGRPRARCLYRSPDGRGLTWYLSGGSAVDYGLCEQLHCEHCNIEMGEYHDKVPYTLI